MDFDWRLSVSLVTGFMAKEVVVSTLGVLFSLGDQNEKSDAFREILRKEVSVPSGIAFIVFVMFYIPCFAATITFGREAGGDKVCGVFVHLHNRCSVCVFLDSFLCNPNFGLKASHKGFLDPLFV